MTIKEIRKEYKKHIAYLENQNYEFIGYEKAQWAVLEELYNEGAVTERLSHIPDEIISLAAGYEGGKNLEGFTVVRCLDLKYIYATKKHARALMMLFLGIEDAEPSASNPEPEQEEKKPEEAAMVRDEYGNEIFVGETIGECQEYCKMHGITGGNGEYIGIGFFTKDRYFEMEDTQEIESCDNWFNDVFLPSLFERAEPLKSIYLTQKQTAVCVRNMEYHCIKDCNGSHEWYTCTWRGRSVELSYSKKNQCGSIRFGRDAEEQEAADKKAMEEQKAQKEELFQIKLESIRSGNQRTIDAVLRRYQLLKERKADMMQDIADGFYTEQEDVYVKNEEELAWISELVKEARKAKQVKEASNHENVHNFMKECTLIEIVMKETTKNTEARQPKGRPPPIKQFINQIS